MTDKTDMSKEREVAEQWLRDRYGAYRGHFAWRELEEAFLAGRASLAVSAESGPLMGQPQEMPDLSALTERGAKAWAGVDARELREGFTAADMATASAQGFRDGVASLAASAGSEPVPFGHWFTDDPKAFATPGSGFLVGKEPPKNAINVIPLYTHPSPPEGMVGGWTKASQQLPPCRDDQLYLGINTAGFAGVFNAVADIAGDVHCMYETPEETIDVMSSLDIWQPFAPPTTSAGSGKGE